MLYQIQNTLYCIPVFLLGLCVGSFLNVMIFWLEGKRKNIKGRSYCPQCKHKLAWYDLIPVMSFIWLRGKCRYCQKRISLQYPAVELATGFLFVISYPSLPAQGGPAVAGLLVSLLLLVFVFDLKHMLIPSKLLYVLLGLGLVLGVFSSIYGSESMPIGRQAGIMILVFWLKSYFLPAVIAALFFAAIHFGSRGQAMGEGDIYLAGFMGLFLGWPKLIAAMLAAFWLGAVVGIFLLVFKKKNWQTRVPFGPFLAAGTLLAWWWGERLLGLLGF